MCHISCKGSVKIANSIFRFLIDIDLKNKPTLCDSVENKIQVYLFIQCMQNAIATLV